MTLCSNDRRWNRKLRLILRLRQVQVMAIFLMTLTTACSSAPPLSTQPRKTLDPFPDAQIIADIVRTRTASVFARAVLCKPRSSGDGGFDITQAPLLAVEVPAANAPSNVSPRPTDLPVLAGQELYADLTRVYVDRATTTIAGRKYDQVTYAWECIVFPDPTVRSVRGMLCGIRTTLSPDGYPLVWETLIDPQYDLVYLSKSFEDAAKARFGVALPGRHFAAERSGQSAAHTLVARVLDDGPMPMGPYVYLADKARFISTLLCRCSASQMDDVVETVEYQLRDAEELGPDWQSRLMSVSPKPLDERLRWPYP